MPPMPSVAKSDIGHSGRFSERIAIRSSWSRPSVVRPIPKARVFLPKSSAETGVQAPFTFETRRSGFPLRTECSK